MDVLDRLIEKLETEDPQGVAEAREWARNLTRDDFVVRDLTDVFPQQPQPQSR